ncbi:unnamed protein product [Closterium sp. Yama58-4]|nr:unnamed protein product [Closterium sp. Yama58-4]
MSGSRVELSIHSEEAGRAEGSSAIAIREAGYSAKTYAGYRAHKRSRQANQTSIPVSTHEPTSHNEQTNSLPDMDVEAAPNAAAAPAMAGTSNNPPASSDPSISIPELLKGWTTKAVKDFRADFKSLLKAKSKLQKMKLLDEQGVILHSLRTKPVEFQTKYRSVREKSAASVAALHPENQKRIQKDFIASKELEVEEILAASNSHVTTLATKLEDYLQSLSANPDLAVSDATKEKYRKIKGACIEKARSEIAVAKDEIIIQELDRQKKREAEELKKAAAAEEMDSMEMDPAINEIVQQHVKKAEEKLRKEFAAKLDKGLSAALQKVSLESKNSTPAPAAASTPPNKKAKKKRGKKKKADAPTDGKEKGQNATSSKKAWFVPTPTRNPSVEADLDHLHRLTSLHFFFKEKGDPTEPVRFRVRNPSWKPDRDVVPESVFKEAHSDLSFLMKATTPRRGFNLSLGVRKALRSLASDRSIVIKPADKNVGVTVLDRQHYINLCMEHLGDEAVYQPILHDPTPQVVKQLRILQTTWGPAFPDSLWKYFFKEPPGGWRPAAFYALPKLHKKVPVGRPIAASHSWVTTPVSKWLDAELRSLVLNRPTYLRDSLSLLTTLERTAFPTTVLLATYDVAALYPSISIERGLDAVSSFLMREKPQLAPPLMAMLGWVMRNSFVEFNGRTYHQVRGTAMGTPVAVCFAVLFMSRLDELLKEKWTGISPLYHARYIDDGLIIWPRTRVELEAYLQTFNALDPDIRITWSISDRSIDFLDAVLFKGPRFKERGTLDFGTYQKPVNKYLYLPFASFHPRHCKESFIRAELRRYLLRSTSAATFLATKRSFFLRLRDRGYPPVFLHPIFKSVIFAHRSELFASTIANQALRQQTTLPSRGPLVLKTQYTPVTARLGLGVLLSRLKNRLITRGLYVEKMFVAWKIGCNLQRLLVRARLPKLPLGENLNPTLHADTFEEVEDVAA